MSIRTYHPTGSRKPSTLIAVVGLVLALVVGTLAAGTPSEAKKKKPKPKSWTRTHRVAPGVKHIEMKRVKGPYRIHVVSIKLNKRSTLDSVLASDQLPGLERTSSMAQRSNALVAINGDYARPSGRPVFTFAADGILGQTPLLWGRNFSANRNETETYIGHPNTEAWMSNPSNGLEFPITRVNAGAPSVNELALFTPQGGYEERPPEDACSARLIRESPIGVLPSHGVEARYRVDAVLCGPKRLALKNGVVVSTPAEGKRVTEITSLIPGDDVMVGWTLGWGGVLDTVGGNPTMIENGQVIQENVSGAGSFFSRHPRTGVGSTPDGRVLFVTVDGRQPGYSVGMTLERFARLFKDLGATFALNLDGGGSTTLVIKGKVKNRPSGGSERSVSSALLLLRGRDQEEIAGTTTSSSSLSTAAAWEEIVADPASTGGLADSLLRAGYPLPPSLLKAAAAFRSIRHRSTHTSR